LVRCLPLPVTDQSQLKAHAVSHLEYLRYRIVEVHILAWMNVGTLLRAMEFVHLEGRDNGTLVRSQVKGLARRRNVSPIPGTDIVIRSSVESSGGCQEPIDGPDLGALLLPT